MNGVPEELRGIAEPVEGEPAWTLSRELRVGLETIIQTPLTICGGVGHPLGQMFLAWLRKIGPAEIVDRFIDRGHKKGVTAAPFAELVAKRDECVRYVAALMGDG